MIYYGKGVCDSLSYRFEKVDKKAKCLDLCKEDQMCTYVAYAVSWKTCFFYNDLGCNLYSTSFDTYKKIDAGINYLITK